MSDSSEGNSTYDLLGHIARASLGLRPGRLRQIVRGIHNAQCSCARLRSQGFLARHGFAWRKRMCFKRWSISLVPKGGSLLQKFETLVKSSLHSTLAERGHPCSYMRAHTDTHTHTQAHSLPIGHGPRFRERRLASAGLHDAACGRSLGAVGPARGPPVRRLP